MRACLGRRVSCLPGRAILFWVTHGQGSLAGRVSSQFGALLSRRDLSVHGAHYSTTGSLSIEGTLRFYGSLSALVFSPRCAFLIGYLFYSAHCRT
jgi:hypothetical protein